MNKFLTYIKHLIRLSRLDKPIGIWLLLFPCVWSLGLAGDGLIFINHWWLLLFAIGAVAMRSLGCIYNDYIDRNLDKHVARTKNRPLASGAVSKKAAFALMIFWGIIGLWVLLHMNPFAVHLGFGSLILVAAYPFMKRITWWPQAFLGLTFNWGALMGFAALTGALPLEAYILYAACFFWTLAYDTIYGHQDKEDDFKMGIKSTARLMAGKTKLFLGICYGLCWGLLVIAGGIKDMHPLYFIACVFVLCHFVWQVYKVDLDNPNSCLKVFKSNMTIGFLMTIGVLLY